MLCAVDLSDLGLALRAARLAAKLRQEDVAGLVGVTQSAVSTWEQGEGLQGVETLVRLASLYKKNINDLVSGLNDDYDALGWASPVTGTSTNIGTTKEGARVPASAQARIRELEQELDALKTAISKSAVELSGLAGDDRLRTARTSSTRRRRKNRKAG